MFKFNQFLDSLEHYELAALKQQIEKGNINPIQSIQNKIKENEKIHAKDCAACSNKLDPYSTSSYTLLFGPEDFKKKASFCGMDCLKYFLNGLEKMKNEIH